MSLRGYHLHSSRLVDGTFSLLVEQTNSSKFLVIQSGAILEHSKKSYSETYFNFKTVLGAETGEQLKRTYNKCADGYGLLGIIRLSNGGIQKTKNLQITFLDEAYLILVNGVFSVGKLHECDVYKIINVQFIPLQYEISEFLDPRIVEVRMSCLKQFYLFLFSCNDY